MRKKKWKVWVERSTVKLLQADDLAVGFIEIFPPYDKDEEKHAPWKGLIRATLTLDPPRTKRRKK